MKSRNGKPAARFRVGDRVQFELWGKKTWGTITEDRGIVGYNGPRWYTISVPMDPDDPELHVMGEDELEPDSISRVPLEKSEIIDFLKRQRPLQHPPFQQRVPTRVSLGLALPR